MAPSVPGDSLSSHSHSGMASPVTNQPVAGSRTAGPANPSPTALFPRALFLLRVWPIVCSSALLFNLQISGC